MKKTKICLAASAGGHISQLLKLNKAWEGREFFFVTTTEVLRDKLQKQAAAYVVGESNRQHPLKALAVLGRCIKVIRTEKPAVVISTGALHGCVICYLAKILCGAKVVWVDSITNVARPSLSGRLVYRIADLFLVQWPELREEYPRAEFAGCII